MLTAYAGSFKSTNHSPDSVHNREQRILQGRDKAAQGLQLKCFKPDVACAAILCAAISSCMFGHEPTSKLTRSTLLHGRGQLQSLQAPSSHSAQCKDATFTALRCSLHLWIASSAFCTWLPLLLTCRTTVLTRNSKNLVSSVLAVLAVPAGLGICEEACIEPSYGPFSAALQLWLARVAFRRRIWVPTCGFAEGGTSHLTRLRRKASED